MRARRKDANQDAIVEMYEKLGCSVQSLHTVGGGCPDLAIGVAGMNGFAEIKDGNKIPSRRRLTKDQLPWHEAWMGEVRIVEREEDVMTHVQELRWKAYQIRKAESYGMARYGDDGK